MTIPELLILTEQQIVNITTRASETNTATVKIKEMKPILAGRKRGIERLESAKTGLVREEEGRKKLGISGGGQESEEGCRWSVRSPFPFFPYAVAS